MASQSWEGKMCPVLSAGVVKLPERSALVGLDGKPPPSAEPVDMNVIPCQGPSCAWFMRIADERGRLVDGNCAVPLATNGIGGLVSLVQGVMVA